MGTSWKSRGVYGSILYRKIKKLDKKFNREMESEQPDPQLLFNYSRALDYSIQIQLSNISKVEEFDMVEIMEKYREREDKLQKVSKPNDPASILTR